MISKNDGNKNIMKREKYPVKSARVPPFPNFSIINIVEESQPRLGTIQPNDILPEFEFTGCLD
jgi:hypothetical protein